MKRGFVRTHRTPSPYASSCFKYLQKGHMLKDCKRERACAHCGRHNHQWSLCHNLFPSSNQELLSELQSIIVELQTQTQLLSIMVSSNQVLMQSATSIVKNIAGSLSTPVHMIPYSGFFSRGKFSRINSHS